MRIVFVGLASSHPFTDAAMLRELGPMELGVVDDTELRDKFVAARGARPLTSLDAALDTQPDAAVVTVHPRDVAPIVAQIAERGVPVFVNKPAAVTRQQLRDLAVVARRVPLMTTSVLRFAPVVEQLQSVVAAEPDAVLLARAVVRHDVGHWEHGDRDWQDLPDGGGLLATIGIHGVEALVSMLGPNIVAVRAMMSRRHYGGIRSGDTATLMLRWASGVLGIVEVLGVATAESYEFCLHRVEGDVTSVASGTANDAKQALGYTQTINALVTMAKTRQSPVPWAQTEAVLGVLADASAALAN